MSQKGSFRVFSGFPSQLLGGSGSVSCWSGMWRMKLFSFFLRDREYVSLLDD